MSASRRVSVLLGAMLALAACGTSASPSATAGPSVGGGPSEPAAVAASCDAAPKPFDPNEIDLTGAWAGDDDGIYYLRQLGSVVWWNGMSGRAGSPSDLGRAWNNVARGEITGLMIDVEWADVPRGDEPGEGTLALEIEDDGTGNIQIITVSQTGTGFGNSIWTPCAPG